MGLFKLLGEVVSLPIKIIEMPVRVSEKLTDADGSPGPTSEMLRDVRRAIIDAGEDVDDD